MHGCQRCYVRGGCPVVTATVDRSTSADDRQQGSSCRQSRILYMSWRLLIWEANGHCQRQGWTSFDGRRPSPSFLAFHFINDTRTWLAVSRNTLEMLHDKQILKSKPRDRILLASLMSVVGVPTTFTHFALMCELWFVTLQYTLDSTKIVIQSW